MKIACQIALYFHESSDSTGFWPFGNGHPSKRGERVAIPEIADYEVRRELLRAGLLKSLRRLDNLKQTLDYIPIQTDTMLLAAELWSESRKTGQPTADAKALDGDVILSAQARLLEDGATDVVVATTNVGHLARFITAADWQSIG